MAKDKAAQEFAKAVERVQQELAGQILDLRNQGLTKNEILLVLESLNMEDIILNKLNLQADIDNLMLEYESVLGVMEMTGEVTEEALTALIRMDRSRLMQQAGLSAETIKTEVARGILGNATEREIAEGILRGSGGVLRPDQAETVANTALNQFERNVTMEMAELDPPNAAYIYQGPMDDKTRDICLNMMSAGPLTRDQIDSQFPGSFSDGGGFNCRHRWGRATSVANKLSDRKGADRVIDNKKKQGKWRTPLTPQQQIEQRG